MRIIRYAIFDKTAQKRITPAMGYNKVNEIFEKMKKADSTANLAIIHKWQSI